MAPDDRRRAIVDATVELLLNKGVDLSTKEIAQAAGVAEGTIFRAFETKDEVINAAICAAMQPDAALARIAELPSNQPLDERVEALLDVLVAEIRRTRSLLLHLAHGRNHPASSHDHRHPSPGGIHDARNRLSQATVDALDGYADQLRIPPQTAGHMLTALAVAETVTLTPDELSPSPETMADVVLHGIAEGA